MTSEICSNLWYLRLYCFWKKVSLRMSEKVCWLFVVTSPSSTSLPTGIYLLKVNNRNTRTGCEICSKLTIIKTRKTPLLWFCCLYCYLWAYFTPCSIVSIVNFKHVIAGWFGKWEYIYIKLIKGKFNFSYNEFHLVLVAFYLAHVTITRNLNLIQS